MNCCNQDCNQGRDCPARFPDDSDLAQCEWCGYITSWDDMEYANDPTVSDGSVTRCPACNEGESFKNYKPKVK